MRNELEDRQWLNYTTNIFISLLKAEIIYCIIFPDREDKYADEVLLKFGKQSSTFLRSHEHQDGKANKDFSIRDV